MKLPYRKNAYIPPQKLTEYLLSETHTLGQLKAKFFESIGYDKTNQTQLEQEFYKIGHNEEVREVASSPYGKKYVIDGIVETPTGRNVKLRTIWIIELNQNKPRFITAYPL